MIEAGRYRYRRGERIDVQAIAAEIGVGRATVYRWFGSRDNLIGEVVIRATEPVLAEARAGQEGRGGPGLLDTFDRFNRALAEAPALRQFLQREREAALRVITSSAGPVQPRVVANITALIEAEVGAGAYDPPVDPETLGYAIVRLAEAFLFNDALADVRGDVDRLRDVEAAILGVTSGR